MKAQELIGKKAVRTKPANLGMSNTGMFSMGESHPILDRSYMSDPIEILKATDTHIVCKTKYDLLTDKDYSPHILSCEYCDDNWIDYDELITIEPMEDK